MQLNYELMPSPVGQLMLVANPQALIAVLWDNDLPERVKLGEMKQNKKHPVLLKAKQQLEEYFKGQRTDFDVPIEFYGTSFQQQVWQALLTIPYGETRSYKQIAQQIGNEKAVRAVGAANGKNPISIIAPCHRVIGTNGKLVGFAGGLERKEILLNIESTQ